MKNVIGFAAVVLMLSATSAFAQPQAKEIAYVATCTTGVHVDDKASNAVTCGKPSITGSGYVIEMATDAGGSVQCPKGYNYIGHVPDTHGSGGSLQHFACVKS
jgi:hypothetical protein